MVDWKEVRRAYDRSELDMLGLQELALATSHRIASSPFHGSLTLQADSLFGRLFGGTKSVGYWELRRLSGRVTYPDGKPFYFKPWTTEWVLLADGRLAWIYRADPDFGPPVLDWRLMTPSDVLELDRKATPYDQRIAGHGGGRTTGWQVLDTNHLIVGKKGNGCKKLLQGLGRQ